MIGLAARGWAVIKTYPSVNLTMCLSLIVGGLNEETKEGLISIVRVGLISLLAEVKLGRG